MTFGKGVHSRDFFLSTLFWSFWSLKISEELHGLEANQKLQLLLSQQMVPEEQQKKLSAS